MTSGLFAAEAGRTPKLLELERVAGQHCPALVLRGEADLASAPAHRAGYRLAFRRGPGQVQRLFELAGLADRFEFLD